MNLFERVRLFVDGDCDSTQADGPAAVVLRHHAEHALVHFVEPVLVDFEKFERGDGGFARDFPARALLGVVAHEAYEVVGDTRRSARASGDFVSPAFVDAHAEQVARAQDNRDEVGARIVVEPRLEREAAAQRRRQKPRARCRPDERKFGHVQADASCVRSLVYHDVDSEILHRAVEKLFDGARNSVDFVDKENVALLQVGKQSREVGRLFDYGSRRYAHLRAHLVAEYECKSRLAQSGRPVKQNVAEGIAAPTRRTDHHLEPLDRLGLPRERVEARRTQGRFEFVLFTFERALQIVGSLFHFAKIYVDEIVHHPTLIKVFVKINFVRLENFRNIGFADVSLDCPNVWICGKNAQGKTNLLEALGMLCALRSFRTSEMSATVACGSSEARVLAGISHEKFGDCQVLLSISAKRRAFIGEEEIKFSDFIGRFPVLAMGNEDVKLLRGSPEVRRRDADMFISSIDGGYFAALRTYHNALAHRNALLRDGCQDPRVYSPFETQMAEAAKTLFDSRREVLGKLGELATQKYEILARENGESADIKIKPNCEVETAQSLLDVLEKNRPRDIERRTTSHGPHRDDFKILVVGRDAKTYASEGQQRSAVIALKLAQFDILRDVLGVRPVLLCDDILGELDASRRAAFWECVDPEAQVAATSTESAPDDALRGRWLTISVKSGEFETR